MQEVLSDQLTSTSGWQMLVLRNELPRIPNKPDIPVTVPWFVEQCKKYADQGCFRIWLFNPCRLPFARVAVFVFDPDLAFEIVGPPSLHMKHGETTAAFRKGVVYGIARPLVGDSILSLADGSDDWKHQRRLAAPGFANRILESVTDVVASILTTQLFPKLNTSIANNTNGVNVVPWLFRFTLDVLGEVAFSYQFEGIQSFDPSKSDEETANNDEDRSMYHTFDFVMTTLTRRIRRPPGFRWLPTSENFRFRKESGKLNKVIGDIVMKRMNEQYLMKQEDETTNNRESRSSSKTSHHKDLLAQLLLRDEEDGARLSHKFVLGNIRMFLFAGHDTTASTISWALWHLATHQDIQTRLRDEVGPLFSQGSPSYAQLRQLPLLNAVMKETLRLNAPGGVGRHATRDVTIGKGSSKEHILPKGAQVYIFPWFTHRLPMYWDRPDDFYPDRFLNDSVDYMKDIGSTRSDKKTPRRPFLPFSMGPRNCLGQQLAMAEIKATLAHFVHFYKFAPPKDANEPLPLLLMTISPHEVMIEFTPNER